MSSNVRFRGFPHLPSITSITIYNSCMKKSYSVLNRNWMRVFWTHVLNDKNYVIVKKLKILHLKTKTEIIFSTMLNHAVLNAYISFLILVKHHFCRPSKCMTVWVSSSLKTWPNPKKLSTYIFLMNSAENTKNDTGTRYKFEKVINCCIM